MAPCALCTLSEPRRAILRRPKTGQAICRECFFDVFETEIHYTILGRGLREKGKGKEKESTGGCQGEGERIGGVGGMFRRGERVAIAASGGKGAPHSHQPASEGAA